MGLNHKKHGFRGFTLTELAIVLGVIGLMLSAIWGAASQVYANKKAAKAVHDLVTITQNVRKLYWSRGRFNCSTQTDITAAMITAGVVPGDMIMPGKTYPQSPWNGDVKIFACAGAPGTDSTYMQIEFWPMPMASKNCSELLSNATGPGQDSGLAYVWFGNGIWTPSPADTSLDVTTFAACDRAAFVIRI